MNRVIITGASGFIGSHVTTYFCEKGLEVGCLVRNGSTNENLKDLRVTLEYGDIEDIESLNRIFSNYDFVVHIAAFAKDWGSYSQFYKVNVEGTLNVLKACSRNAIKDVITTSSVSVYGEENCNTVKDETWPAKSHYKYFLDKIFPSGMNFYRDTKALAKQKAIEYAESQDMNLTILEPVWVFGEREFNTGFYEYIKTVKEGMPVMPGCTTNKFHVIYAGDLARAYFLAFEKRLQGINNLIIGNREAELMNRIYSIFCERSSLKKPPIAPKLIFYPAAFLIELLYSAFRIKSTPLLTRGRVNMFYDNIEYSTEKAAKLIGFTAEYSLEESIERTVKWYKERNLI